TALLLVVALQVHTLDDSDTWWHLASGRLIAAERAVARADPFSFTAPGAPWINRQWLFDLAAYGTWRAGGPAGPILLAAALFTAAFATLYALARRRLPAWGAAALVVLAAQAAETDAPWPGWPRPPRARSRRRRRRRSASRARSSRSGSSASCAAPR